MSFIKYELNNKSLMPQRYLGTILTFYTSAHLFSLASVMSSLIFHCELIVIGLSDFAIT